MSGRMRCGWCAVEVTGGEARWKASAVEELPAGAVVEGVVRDGGLVVAAMGRAMEGIEVDAVSLGHRGRDSIVKAITVPPMTEAELAEQIVWEAEQHVPFDAKACALEYRPLGEGRVQLTAMRNETFEALVTLAKEANIELGAVELVEEALLRVLRLSSTAAEPQAIIAALADATLTVIARGGELVEAKEGEPRRVVDFSAEVHDAKAKTATVVGPRAKASLAELQQQLEIPVALWRPPDTLKPTGAEFAIALGLALPGPPSTRVGAPKKRGLWARLFG